MMLDVLYHFLAGALISTVILLLWNTSDWAVASAFVASFIVGTAKEAFDMWVRHKMFDVSDITATWAGGIFAIIVIKLVENLT